MSPRFFLSVLFYASLALVLILLPTLGKAEGAERPAATAEKDVSATEPAAEVASPAADALLRALQRADQQPVAQEQEPLELAEPFRQALDFLQRTRGSVGKVPLYVRRIALALGDQGQWDEARQVARLIPNSDVYPNTLAQLGRKAVEADQPDLAREMLEEALTQKQFQRGPHAHELKFHIALLQADLGDVEDARAFADLEVEGSAYRNRILSRLMILETPPGEVPADPSKIFPQEFLTLGRRALANNQPELAAILFSRGLDNIVRKETWDYLDLAPDFARGLAQAGHPEDAREVLDVAAEVARKLSPEIEAKAGVLGQLAVGYHQTGFPEQAQELLAVARDAAGQPQPIFRVESHSGVAKAAWLMGEKALAQEHWTQALREVVANPNSHVRTLGAAEVYLTMGAAGADIGESVKIVTEEIRSTL